MGNGRDKFQRCVWLVVGEGALSESFRELLGKKIPKKIMVNIMRHRTEIRSTLEESTFRDMERMAGRYKLS